MKFAKQARITFANKAIYVHTDSNFTSGKFPELLDMVYFNITQYKKHLR